MHSSRALRLVLVVRNLQYLIRTCHFGDLDSPLGPYFDSSQSTGPSRVPILKPLWSVPTSPFQTFKSELLAVFTYALLLIPHTILVANAASEASRPGPASGLCRLC